MTVIGAEEIPPACSPHSPEMSSSFSSPVEKNDAHAWQRTLLPFLLTLLGGLTIFFLVTSLIQVSRVQQKIEQGPVLNVDGFLATQDASFSTASYDQRLLYLQWKTLAALEAHALQSRYHQANVLLISRVWFGYLGILTGMTMAMVGASFILARLREPQSSVSGGSRSLRVDISSASPGLILSLIGAALMITATLNQRPIEINDGPIYTPSWIPPSGAATAPSDKEIIGAVTKRLQDHSSPAGHK